MNVGNNVLIKYYPWDEGECSSVSIIKEKRRGSLFHEKIKVAYGHPGQAETIRCFSEAIKKGATKEAGKIVDAVGISAQRLFQGVVEQIEGKKNYEIVLPLLRKFVEDEERFHQLLLKTFTDSLLPLVPIK